MLFQNGDGIVQLQRHGTTSRPATTMSCSFCVDGFPQARTYDSEKYQAAPEPYPRDRCLACWRPDGLFVFAVFSHESNTPN
jgi:hypothetical protein